MRSIHLPDVLVIASAALAYAASSATTIRLRRDIEIAPVAAFGPALVALGPGGYEVLALLPILLVATMAEVGFRVVLRRSVRPVPWNMAVVATSSVLLLLLSRSLGVQTAVGGRSALIIAVATCSILYLGKDVLALAPTSGFHEKIGVAKLLAPVHVVMASSAWLVVLAFPLIGWTMFLLLLIPLIVMRTEFEGKSDAHATYEQTVQALGRLAEHSGYVPVGHHSRVASLVVAVGRELRLSSKVIDGLRLVSLLHDVGAVTLDSDARNVDEMRHVVVANGIRVLEDSQYLRPFVNILQEQMDPGPASTEARILYWCDAWDRLGAGEVRRRLRLSACTSLDEAIVDALDRFSAQAGQTAASV